MTRFFQASRSCRPTGSTPFRGQSTSDCFPVQEFTERLLHHQKTWTNDSSYISTVYDYDDHQLSSETIDGKTREFTYSKGVLQSETRGSITFFNNGVNKAGLIMSTTDSADNSTGFGMIICSEEIGSTRLRAEFRH